MSGHMVSGRSRFKRSNGNVPQIPIIHYFQIHHINITQQNKNMATVNKAIKNLKKLKADGYGDSELVMTDRGNDYLVGLIDGCGSKGFACDNWSVFMYEEDWEDEMEGTPEENGYTPAIYWYN